MIKLIIIIKLKKCNKLLIYYYYQFLLKYNDNISFNIIKFIFIWIYIIIKFINLISFYKA